MISKPAVTACLLLPFSLFSILTLGRCNPRLRLFRFSAVRFRHHVSQLLLESLLLCEHALHLRLRQRCSPGSASSLRQASRELMP